METPSGGVLMDIAGDRFMSLTPLSANIWRKLSLGAEIQEIVAEVSTIRKIPSDAADELLTKQLRAWERAGLVNPAVAPGVLPLNRVSIPPALLQFSEWQVQSASLGLLLMLSLLRTEAAYRRLLSRLGLAGTLNNLQQEHSSPGLLQENAIAGALRNYHALRRAFRQSDNARDCLIRSLALAAVLRRDGVDAQLCIGITDLPFRSHAWVEAQGHVLNERLAVCERYSVLGRF